jgi:hypothetical protein
MQTRKENRQPRHCIRKRFGKNPFCIRAKSPFNAQNFQDHRHDGTHATQRGGKIFPTREAMILLGIACFVALHNNNIASQQSEAIFFPLCAGFF